MIRPARTLPLILAALLAARVAHAQAASNPWIYAVGVGSPAAASPGEPLLIRARGLSAGATLTFSGPGGTTLPPVTPLIDAERGVALVTTPAGIAEGPLVVTAGGNTSDPHYLRVLPAPANQTFRTVSVTAPAPGAPAAGAVIALHQDNCQRIEIGGFAPLTGGAATLQLRDGNYIVLVIPDPASGYAAASGMVAVSGGAAALSIPVVDGVPVSGRALAAGGGPLPGGHIMFRAQFATLFDFAVTDAAGNFQRRLAPGSWGAQLDLPATRPELPFTPPNFAVAAPGPVILPDWALSGAARQVTGRVLDARGNPVANAEVEFAASDNSYWEQRKSDGSGYYSFTIPDAIAGGAPVVLTARINLAAPLTDARADFTAQAGMNVNLYPLDAGFITGQLTAPGGAPLSGISVQAVNPHGWMDGYSAGPARYEATSCADGTYRLRLPAGPDGFWITAGDDGPSPLRAAETWSSSGPTPYLCEGTPVKVNCAGQTVTGIDLELPAAGGLQINVQDQGAGCALVAFSNPVRIDDGGNHACGMGRGYMSAPGSWQMGGIPAGPVRVCELRAGAPYSCYNQKIAPAYDPVMVIAGTSGAVNLCRPQPSPGPLTMIPTRLPDGDVGRAFPIINFRGQGGMGPFSYLSTGLPPGLSLDVSGKLSGVPAAPSISDVTITVKDLNGDTASLFYPGFRVYPALAVTTTALPAGAWGAAYSQTLATTGGRGGAAWSIGGLPAGLSGNGSGAISGTPSGSGQSTVDASVSDAYCRTAGASIPLTIRPVVTTLIMPTGSIAAPYAATLTAGGSGPFTWSGGAPPGLALSAAGAVSGAPLSAGAFGFNPVVTDASGVTGTASLPITVVDALRIADTALPVGLIGVPYPAHQLTALGGTAPYTFALTGALPPGLSFNNGLFTGTPVADGSWPLQLSVSDGAASGANLVLTLVVQPPPVVPRWEARGLFGGIVDRLILSPDFETSRAAFAYGLHAQEVFRYDAPADRWNRLATGPETESYTILDFALSPVYTQAAGGSVDERTMFVAGRDFGVAVSTDRGASWSDSSTGLPCQPGGSCPPGTLRGSDALWVSPGFTVNRTLWTVAVDGSDYPAVTWDLYRSTDAGASWSWMSAIPGATSTGDRQDVIRGAPDDSVLMVGGGDKVWRSTNGGATLTLALSLPAVPGASPRVTRLLFSPDFANDMTVFVEDEAGRIFRSRDAGQIFTQLPVRGVRLSAVARPGLRPRYFLKRPGAPGDYSIHYSDSDGDAWAAQPGAGSRPAVQFGELIYSGDMGAHRASDGTIRIFNNDALVAALSEDGGMSFNPRTRGLVLLPMMRLSGVGNGEIFSGGVDGWYRSRDAGNTWTKQRPPVSGGSGSVIRPQVPSPAFATDRTLFLMTLDTLHRSDDGGQTYQPLLTVHATRMEGNISRLVAAPDFHDNLGDVYFSFMADPGYSAESGLYRYRGTGYDIGGAALYTISQIALPASCFTPGPDAHVLDIALSPAYAADRTLFVTSSPVLHGNQPTSQGCRSPDGGVTWQPFTYPGDGGPEWVGGQLGVSPAFATDNTLFMVGRYDYLNLSGPRPKLLRSTDRGASWQPLPADFPEGFANEETQITVSPAFASDGVLFIASDSSGSNTGLWRSADGGLNFTHIHAGLRTRNTESIYLTADFNGQAATGVAVAAVSNVGIFRSTDGGLTFTAVEEFQSISPRITAVAAAGTGLGAFGGESSSAASFNATLVAGTEDQGVFLSRDRGVSFERFSAGLPGDARITALIAPAGDPSHPIAAVAGRGLWRYGGVAWSSVGGGAGTFPSLAEEGGVLYAAREDGLSLKSLDNGATWLTQDPGQPALSAIAGADGAALHERALAPKRPAGPPSPDMPALTAASLWAVAPGDGPRYSTNNAGSWIIAQGGGDYGAPVLPGSANNRYNSVGVLGIHPATGGRIVLAGTTSGLWRTQDGGETWRRVDVAGSGLEATSRNFSTFLTSTTPQGTTDLLIGANGATTGGVYLSGDGGEHWTQVNQGFDPAQLSISTLVKTSCAGCPVQYYSGSYGGGLYTRTIAVVAAPSVASWNFGNSAGACGNAPPGGPIEGGQPFRLCGTNFQAGAVVEFDGVPAGGCVTLNAGAITCAASPAHVAGAAIVRVRNPDTRASALGASYLFTGGVSARTGNSLRVAKNGGDAALTWSCPGCTAQAPARVYRSQNPLFSAFLEQYGGGTGGAFGNAGAIGSGASYFWSVE